MEHQYIYVVSNMIQRST